jgi:L-fucose mutarotase
LLIGIDPLLCPESLAALRAMGHGDTLVLADANFPAESHAERIVRMPGVPVATALRAVLGVLPLDDFEPDPLVRMQVVGRPEHVPDVVREMQGVVDELVPGAPRIAAAPRHDFYGLARRAFVIIATGERAFYGNLIVRKGVVPPP